MTSTPSTSTQPAAPAPDFLSGFAKTQPDKAALIEDRPDGTMRRWSYAELNRRANQLANAFLGFGLEPRAERAVVRPELARGGAHGPRRAQERHHLGADELPPVGRGGGLRHRQLGRPR